MTDRDAFGRPISGSSGPFTGPTAGHQQFGAGPAGGGPPRQRRTGRCIWWFVVIDVIILVTVGAFLLMNSGGSGADDDIVVIPPDPAAQQAGGNDSGDPLGDAPDDVEPPAQAVAPAGFNETSLLRPANLKRALVEAKAASPGRPLMLRAEPSRVDLQLAKSDGSLVILQVAAGAGPRIVSTVPGAARSRKTMSWSAIKPAAPKRLATSTKSTPESGPRSTNYVVFLAQTDQWVLYRKSGRGFTSGPSGSGGTPIPGT